MEAVATHTLWSALLTAALQECGPHHMVHHAVMEVIEARWQPEQRCQHQGRNPIGTCEEAGDTVIIPMEDAG